MTGFSSMTAIHRETRAFVRAGLLSICVMIGAYTPALAAEDRGGASSTYRLFSASCLRLLAIPQDVRIWASKMQLSAITDPAQLNTFVGPGKNGVAWDFPRTFGGKYSLSIRGTSQACAVWAESGDPQIAEELFRKVVSGAATTGAVVTTDDDQSFSTADGKGRILIMSVTSKNGAGYQFTLMTGERPGAFFAGAPVQLSMQMLQIAAKK